MAESPSSKARCHVVTVTETRTWTFEVDMADGSPGMRSTARDLALVQFEEARTKNALEHDGYPTIRADWVCAIRAHGRVDPTIEPDIIPTPVPRPKPDDDGDKKDDRKGQQDRHDN